MPTPLADVVKGVARLPREIIDAAVDRFDDLAVESAALVVGNGGVMNMHTARGPRPVRMRTSAKVDTRGAYVVAIIRGRPGGPWVWIEDGTNPHDIRARKRRGRGAAKKRPRALAGGGLAHPVYVVHHKGSTGRRAWTRAVANLEGEMGDLIEVQLREIVRG